jgi:hypothetical protein
MTAVDDRLARRARRLVRSYPPKWRARYGDEFVELLVEDLRERRRSLPLTADVLRGATVARLREAGVGDRPLGPLEQLDASMTALVWSLAACFLVGVAMWSQVVVGWRWEPPGGHAVAIAMVLMSAAVATLCALAVLASVPIVWTLVRSVAHGRGRAVTSPALVWSGSASVVLLGCRHFAGGWPGTGGHDWGHRGLVPAGPASFGWAATRGISAYWAHPGVLASFPVMEVLWMLLSPLALVALVASSARIVHRLDLSQRVLRYEVVVAAAAVAVELMLALGAGAWVLDNGAPGPTGIYRVGMIDFVGLGVMAAASAVAYRAAIRAHNAIGSGCYGGGLRRVGRG